MQGILVARCRETILTFQSLDASNSDMRRVTWLKLAAVLMLLPFAVVTVGSFLHGHHDNAAGDDHCAVCHVQHLSYVETAVPPSVLMPRLLQQAVVSEACSLELNASRSSYPSRGPPA